MSTSPRILSLSWGVIEVDGLGTMKDAKLFPGGGHEWDWRETGTRHSPGIQIADIEDLIEYGATTVVLSRGQELRLEVGDEVLDYLSTLGIVTHVAETSEAVDLYNALIATEPVAGLFHSTC